MVAQPSSLTQRQIDNLTDYVKKGGATLLFLDPYPVDRPDLSPEVPKMPPGGPFGGGQPPEPKGNLRPLLDLIGIDWPSTEIVWNAYNPHPQLADLPEEIVFIGKGSGAKDAFNPEQIASSDLQEVVAIFAGLLRPKSGGSGPEFIPLLRTSDAGGTLSWNDAVQQGFMGNFGIKPRRPRFPSRMSYTLAARIVGSAPVEAATRKGRNQEGCREEEGREAHASACQDQRDRHRRPGHDLRELLRAPPAQDRKPRFRQRFVRPQLRRCAGRRRVVCQP